MSNWTHVVATVRFDSFREYTIDDFYKLFGKECLWNDSEDIWEDAENNPQDYLPMGSEGSLQLSLWTNPKSSHLCKYMVNIFGDLRDHDNPQAIVDWFNNKLTEINESDDYSMWIRQATILADNEKYGAVIDYIK